MDDFFLFDMTVPEINEIRKAAMQGKSAAMKKINEEFGSPIRDAEGYGKRVEQYRAVREGIEDDPFEISAKDDLAKLSLNLWRDTKERLKRDFDVDADVDATVRERLEKISKLYQSRPVKVTDELIGWANREV
jgi:hypothetical protein